MDANWQRFLFPRTIAILGASESGFSSGNIFRNLRGFGFAGEIIPVHPRHATVFGLRAYPSLQDAPSADAVIVLLGRDRVEEAVEQAIAARAGGVILPAGGFRESGDPAWIAAEEAHLRRGQAGGDATDPDRTASASWRCRAGRQCRSDPIHGNSPPARLHC